MCEGQGHAGSIPATSTIFVSITAADTPPVIDSANTAAGTYGMPFNYTITAVGGATSFAVSGLPPGLSVESSTAVISGIPNAAGEFTVTMSASKNGGLVGTSSFALTIEKAPRATTVTAPTVPEVSQVIVLAAQATSRSPRRRTMAVPARSILAGRNRLRCGRTA